jgi:hypothetical protein
MQTIYFLRQHTDNEYLGQALLLHLAKTLLLEGRQTAREYQRILATAAPTHSPHDIATPALLWHTNNNNSSSLVDTRWNYDLGMPYGLVGILTTLLALSEDEWSVIENVSEFDVDGDILRNARPLIKQTIDKLPKYGCHVSGNLRTQLDNALQEVDRQVDWSHGAPAHVLLLLSAHWVFGENNQLEESYLEQAQRLAEEVVWARRILLTKNGLGIMTGMSGNAYVLLQLAQALSAASKQPSKEPNQVKLGSIWKQRGEQLARHCVHHWRELLAISTVGQQWQAPYSLMGGLGGLVSLLMDLNHPHALSQIQIPFLCRSVPVVTFTAPAMAVTRNSSSARLQGQRQKIYKEMQEELAQREATQSLDRSRSPRRRPERNASPIRPVKTTHQPTQGNTQPASATKEMSLDKDSTLESVSTATKNLPDKTFLQMKFSASSLGGDGPLYFTDDTIVLQHEQHDMTTNKDHSIIIDAIPEFMLPNPNDTPDERYLKLQSSNVDDDVYDFNSSRSKKANPPLLDEEAHQITFDQMLYGDDANEFEDPQNNDIPDERFLRLQDTDDEDNAAPFYSQDGGALNPSMLDDEGHVISTPKLKNGTVDGHDAAGVPDFASARNDEKPDINFLQLQDPAYKGDSYYRQDKRIQVNPPLLDEEDHPTSRVRPMTTELEELTEFHAPAHDDLPNEEFLRMQESNDDMKYEMIAANKGKALLDEEALLRNNKRAIAKSWDETDVDEFVESNCYDEPIKDYLRKQDSADEMFFQYEVDANPAMLDEEAHTMDNARIQRRNMSEYSMSDEEFSEQDYEMEAYRPPVPSAPGEEKHDIVSHEEDGDEFEIAAESDQPDNQYLRSNMSIDNIVLDNGKESQDDDIRLDEDGHCATDFDLLNISKAEEDVDEFGETADDEAPDSRYLLRQDSSKEIYYDHHGDQERLLESKKHVKAVAKEAAIVASKTTLNQTPTRKKGRKNDFKRRSAVRGTPASTCTATTAATSLPSPLQKTKLSPAAYVDLAKSCFQDAKGEGNLLNGGLGVAVYLRVKLSEIETNPSKASEYLNAALDYAQAAVDDSRFDSGEKKYLSLISGDTIGSHCLLASVLLRLGKRDKAKTIADAVAAKLADLYEVCDKDDCSVLFGLAGALQAIWFLRKELCDPSFGREIALTISSTILLEGLEHSEKYDTNALLMWEWHDRPFLGAGTGASGILYSLLGHTEEEWKSLDACLPRVLDVIRQCVDSLSEHQLESGNLKAAADGYEEDQSTDWCHGAPGYLFLLLKAYEVFADRKYFEKAISLAEHVIWPRRMQRKGLGLSRGVTGIAYALLALAHVDSGNWKLWRSRAARIAQLALDDVEELQSLSKNPHSLFEGKGGLVSLLIDLECPTAEIWFPFFEYSVSSNCRTAFKRNQQDEVTNANDVSAVHNGTPQSKGGNDSFYTTPVKNKNPATPNGKSTPGGTKSRGYPKSGAATATTATNSSAAQEYGTPPRRTVMAAVSPLTEPSQGPIPDIATTKHTQHERQCHQDLELLKPPRHARFSSKICPPQVKHHIHTCPDDVPLAEQPTLSWLAKRATSGRGRSSRNEGLVDDKDDVFTRDSIERRLRAEESWVRHEMDIPHVRTLHQNEEETSFRRIVGGFSKPIKSAEIEDRTTGNVAKARQIVPREESLHEKFGHVVEELSERLEDMELIE